MSRICVERRALHRKVLRAAHTHQSPR